MKKKLRSYAFWLLILSFGGVVAAFWQTAEKIHFLKNPDVALSCNLNPIVDCGTVLNHNLSSVFGVANSLIGIVAFSLLLGAGVFLSLGTKPNKETRKFIVLVASIMMLFSIWFFGVSLYVIGKICLFCVGIWTVTIPLFIATIREYDDTIFRKKKLLRRTRTYIHENPLYSVVIIYIVAIGLFLLRFSEYYFK